MTSVLDPQGLPPFVVADLHRRRWRIEDAFNTAKRLLNLSYLWTGSVNGIPLQIWATWLFYVVLVDLGDAVADAMNLPWWRISLEMRHQGFYHFIQQGKTSALVVYFAAPENQDWAVVNSIRSPIPKLNIAPYGKHCVAQDRLQQPASHASSIADKPFHFQGTFGHRQRLITWRERPFTCS